MFVNEPAIIESSAWLGFLQGVIRAIVRGEVLDPSEGRVTIAAGCVAIIAFFARLKAAVAAIRDAGAGFKRAIRGVRDSPSGAAFVCISTHVKVNTIPRFSCIEMSVSALAVRGCRTLRSQRSREVAGREQGQMKQPAQRWEY